MTLECRDTGCRPILENMQKPLGNPAMKNLFAVIGLCVVLKKGYEFYREYSELKRDRQRPPPSAS